jgi:3-hydroxy-5-methyl-1-naphthoate 3-O-methyltransferase
MTTTATTPVTPERILQLAWAYVPPLVLEAAIRNRIFDVLDSGPKSLPQVSKETGASQRGLAAVMNVLVGLELLAKDKQGNYSLTPESSAFLVSTKPSFQGGFLRHGSEQLIPKWLHLNKIVQTGKPDAAVNQEGPGSDFFGQFVNDILPLSYPGAQALSRHLLDGGKSAKVLDLAAGSGVWGIAMAQASDKATVTAVDWPDVLPITRKTVARFGVADRFSFIGGDLLQADFGSGHTVAILGHILHSEGIDRSRELLKKTFRALASGGTIAIAEFLVNSDRTGPMNALMFAVNMLVNTDEGGTYSFEEIGGWLKEAGFVDARTLNAPGPSPLVLATKP